MEQLGIQNGDLVECIDVNGREDFLLLGGLYKVKRRSKKGGLCLVGIVGAHKASRFKAVQPRILYSHYNCRCSIVSSGESIKDNSTITMKITKNRREDMNGALESRGSVIINSTVLAVFPDGNEAALVTEFVGDEYPENSFRALQALKRDKDAVLEYCKGREQDEKIIAARA